MRMERPAHVLMFGWEFPPYNSGGLGVACAYLSKALVKRNVRVTFVLPKRVNASSDEIKLLFADIDDISVTPVDTLLHPYITSSRYAFLKNETQNSIYGWGLFDEVRRYADQARIIARENDFDVIHAHDWLSFPAGIAAKRATGKPLVIHVHATEFDRTGNGNINREVYAIEQAGMNEADAVVAVSNFTKNIITERYGVPGNKVHVVHNAVHAYDYSRNDTPLSPLAKTKQAGAKIVLFVGRLTLQKGPDYFLRAAKRVLEFEPDTLFVIAGSGDMERQVINEAAYLGIADKVLFTGFLRDQELNALYQAADLYVLPSVSEPFGITPLEAIANGTPVIISKQSGVSEVLSHALRVDFWDTEEMANKIIGVLRHNSLREHLRDMGLREIVELTWERAAEKCINVYKKLLQPTAA